ncbi:EamA family transporter (plasmid) [Ralstonia solanacearum]|uniref:DMT family transporter n=1 Tax=Ralstonia solanacearum TaxID=305 RepID=UPI0009C02E7E|nr:DMT family transporter [Ralstonia solanacearum]QHB56505.1 EamA family transporter [Ralstonia solanacearum]
MTTSSTSMPLAPTPRPSSEPPALSPMLSVKLITVALFWGGTFIAGRVLAQALPLMVAAFGRFLVAAILLVWAAFHIEGRPPRLNRSQLLTTAAMGLTGICLYNVCFFGALARLPAGRTALFVSLTPIVTALMASLVFRERLESKRWVGIGIALMGALIVITRGDLAGAMRDIGASIGLGEMLMSLAVLNWAAYTLISRKATESMSSIVATTYAALWGLAFLSVGAMGELGAVRWLTLGWQVWASVFYLGAIGTVVAFIWYSQGIRAVGPSRTAVFTNLVPAFGVVLSAGLLGEAVLASMLVGGALSAIGVSLANRK